MFPTTFACSIFVTAKRRNSLLPPQMPHYKIVAGLQSRPALNGTAVEMRQLDETSGRHMVRTADGEMIKLKAQNLVAFADAGVSDMRERGNAAFTAKRFYEAIEWYTAAISPGDSRPKANRAAAFLEVGDYGACEKDVADALLLVEPDAAAKLYCRLAKAQAYAGKYDEALESFMKVSGEVDTTSAQLQAALHRIRDQAPDCCPYQASELPSCRAGPITACEFYTISNEDPKSALGGRFVQHVEQADRVALDGSRIVRIFFGGVGDGRHVLSTLIDLRRRLPSHAPPVEMTLNDVKAETLARDLLLLTLLHDLGVSLAGGDARHGARGGARGDARHGAGGGADSMESNSPAAMAALQLYYVYLGVFVPPEQHARLSTAIHRLASSEAPPSLVSCSEVTWRALRGVFQGWATSPLLTVPLVDSMYNVSPDDGGELARDYAGTAGAPQLAAMEEERRRGFIEYVQQCDESTLNAMPGVPGATAAEKRAAMLSMANSPEFGEIDRSSSSGDPCSLSAEYKREFVFWAHSKLLPLPDSWRTAHGCESYGGTNGVASAKEYDGAAQKQLGRLRARSGRLGQLWHPNVTLVDVPYIGAQCGGLPCPPQELYLEPFKIVQQLATGLGPLDGRSLFHSTISTFRPAARALADLLAGGQVKLSLEVGDAHAAFERVTGQGAPLCTFDRIYLSNVPDYTSMLNAFLYFSPALRRGGRNGDDGDGEERPAVLEHELLLNTLLWSSLEQYVFSSTALRPSDYWLLGVRLVSGDHMDRDGKPRWCACDSGECRERFRQAGRPSVDSWLHRLLLACVLPPLRDASGRMRESCPLTLSTVFRAVERLKLRGCPAHWLIDFLNSILAGRLRTAAVPPASSPLTLPESDPCLGRASVIVDLAFCKLEASTLAAVWDARLQLPLSGGAVAAHIRKHTVPLKPSWIPMDRTGLVIAAPVVGLVIADPSFPPVDAMLRRLEQPFASGGHARELIRQSPPGSCHLLSVVHWNDVAHEATFYMPAQELASITASGSKWVAILVRTDSWVALTSRSAMAAPEAPASAAAAAAAAPPPPLPPPATAGASDILELN